MADKSRGFILHAIKRCRARGQTLFSFLLTLVAKRRRQLIGLSLILLVLRGNSANLATARSAKRSCRRLKRNIGWWKTVSSTYSASRFKKTFRISRATFDFILEKIRHRLQRETKSEDPISPEERLAICLYRLARGDYYFTISEMVSRGLSTVSSIVPEVCEAIVEEMWDSSVSCHIPTTEDDLKGKILDTEELWQFPCCWAAIDGCHIPIKCPDGDLEACKEYHNFKNFYSIVLMGLVDAKYRFVWATCGFPGNNHDSIIFQSTNLWNKIEEENYLPEIAKKVFNVSVPPLIIGDSAFPFCPWLMKPYGNSDLTRKQSYFNYRLSRARMVTECAYGQLKGRWRVLLRKCESSRDAVRLATLTCIVLHNVCIDHGDSISKKLDLTLDPVTQERRNRAEIRELLQMRDCPKVKNTSGAAQKIQNALSDKLWQEKVTGIVC